MALLLYGDVGYAFTSKDVASYLKANKKGPIHVRINSQGGDVFEGMSIHNLLRTSGRRVEVEIDGQAASAASVIAMAGDDIAIARGGFIMIHRSSSMAFGNSEDMQKRIAVMSKIDEAMAEIYSARTAQAPRDIIAMMEAETWMNADEAIAKGFATRKSTSAAVAASGASHSAWTNAPEEVKRNLQPVSDAATVVTQGHNKESMTPEQLQAAITAALAPLSARIDAIQASAAPAAPAVAPEPEPVVTIEEPVEDNAAAEVKAMFTAAVNASFDRFAAAGKLVPAAREFFVTACATPASFKAVCSMYESAPAIVSTEPIVAAAIKPAKRVYAPETVRWAKESGIDLEALDAKESK